MKGNAQDVALTPREGGDGDYAAGASPKRSRAVHIGLGVFFLINIIVLYVLHFADRGNSSTSAAVAGQFSTSSLTAATSASTSAADAVSKGHAVSFTAAGTLTKGAGTTAYLAAAGLPAGQKNFTYVHFAKLGTSKKAYDTNIMSYVQGSDRKSAITTVSKVAGKKELAIAAPDDKNLIPASVKGLATLSDSAAIAVTTTTAPGGRSYLVDVYPIAIAGGKVTVGAKTFAVNNSATNFIGRVSDSAFAIAYYEPYSESAYFQRVMVGSLGADGQVAFSNSLVFGKANAATSTTFGRPQSVLKTNDHVTVPWYADSYSATKDNRTIAGAPGLCLTTAKLQPGNFSSLGDVCNSQVQPAYFVESTPLSDSVLAFIFFDRSNNFALTVAAVEFSALTGSPTFRSTFVVEEAAGAYDFGFSGGFSPQPTIQALSDSRLAVSFFNPSNLGRPSVKVLKYASDLTMTDASPVLPISNLDFLVESANPDAYGSIVLDMVPLESGFVVGYAGLWGNTQFQRVVLVESFGKPVGVVSDVDGSDVAVATAGTVELSTGLTRGNAYYASTEGELYTPSSTTSDEYVLVRDNSVVISKDALVGVAVSSDKLFVTGQIQ
ncbi:hypothetical protein PybrP1_008415 [[Pythium] brassicae (nom. inval.)]|nr:hypothetical protein PybrP1_008415 [[Pythium] brassicae (nom. inval.)]